MDTTCPVTRAYLYAVRNLYDLTLVQHEMYAEPLEDLLNIAAHDSSERMRQHQRAFYCVELMASRFPVIPPMLPWPRSREGLDYVLHVANERRDDHLAELTEQFYSGIDLEGIAERQHDNMRAASEIYKLICESCVILRQSLKNPDVPLTRVGKRLALASNSARYYISGMLDLATELLNHTEGKNERAWEQPRT